MRPQAEPGGGSAGPKVKSNGIWYVRKMCRTQFLSNATKLSLTHWTNFTNSRPIDARKKGYFLVHFLKDQMIHILKILALNCFDSVSESVSH